MKAFKANANNKTTKEIESGHNSCVNLYKHHTKQPSNINCAYLDHRQHFRRQSAKETYRQHQCQLMPINRPYHHRNNVYHHSYVRLTILDNVQSE